MSKPTLTIAVPCPTCGGSRVVLFRGVKGMENPCDDCTDGTIRQAVSCAGCKHIQDGRFRPDDDGLFGMCELFGKTHLHYVKSDWGCLSWEAKA